MNKVVHFVEVENKFEATWSYECEPIPDVSIDSIAYLLFSDESGFWLGEVNRWSDVRQVQNNIHGRRWIFNFGRGRGFGSHAADLKKLCNRNLSDADLFTINGHFFSFNAPVEDPDIKNVLALDLSEARDAVANYYRVESRQIEILIKSN